MRTHTKVMWNQETVEAKTAEFLTNPNRIPHPSECKSGNGDFVATFGKCEIEIVAQMVTLLSKKRGAWAQKFTENKLRRLWRWGIRSQHWVITWLDALVNGYQNWPGGYLEVEVKPGWFGSEKRLYSVTPKFGRHLLKAQLRNARIAMGIANDDDIMESLGFGCN